MTQADRIRDHLCEKVEEAWARGESVIIFRAGHVHDDLGLKNYYAEVCRVLNQPEFHEKARVEKVRTISSTDSGQGANVVIEFCILGPRRRGKT